MVLSSRAVLIKQMTQTRRKIFRHPSFDYDGDRARWKQAGSRTTGFRHDSRLFVSFRAYVGAQSGPEKDPIRSNRVVIKLENKESGKKFSRSFEVDIGHSTVDNEEAFEFLYPGTYMLEVRTERHYRSKRYVRGSRKSTRGELKLRE